MKDSMKIGILLTGHAPSEVLDTLGTYPEMFTRLLSGHDFTFETFTVVDGHFPASVNDADGWLISGSKHGAYEDHAWIPPLEQFIRDTYADGRPMIGVCFGHQIIAQAMGGTVEKFKDGWAVGVQTYDFDGTDVVLNAWHKDQVTKLPAEATVIATNDFCENAALLYGDRMLTVQPHPEFSADMVAALITHRGKGNLPDHLLVQADANLDTETANQHMADRMAAFFLQGDSK